MIYEYNHDLIKLIEKSKPNGKGLTYQSKSYIPFYIFLFAVANIPDFPNPAKAISDTLIWTATLTLVREGTERFLESKGKSQRMEFGKRFNEFATQLNYYLDLNTTPELLMQSEQYDQKTFVTKNSKSTPCLMQEKYLYIPTRDGNEISLKQEHELFTKVYTFSQGTPSRVLKPALSRI